MEDDEEVCFEIETSTKIHPTKDEVRWTLNGRRLDTDDERKYSFRVDGKHCKLVIKKVKLEDEGTYMITLNGESRSSAQLTVNELPVRFVKPLRDQKCAAEQTATFECELSKATWKKTGHPVVVKWMRGERELRENIKYTVRKDDVRHSLLVKDVELDDQTEYTAVVVNERTSAKLEVTDNDLVFTSPLKNVEVNEKDNCQFECEVNKMQTLAGEPLPIVWYRKLADGTEEKLYKTTHFEPTRVGKKIILKINTALLEDAGAYIVTVGSARAEAKLTVNELPCTFKNPLEDRHGKEGLSTTFECTINRPDKTPKWFVNDELVTKELIKSGKYTVNQEKGKLQLTIHNLDLAKDNEAKVTCQVGDSKPTRSSARLYVDEDDIKFVERLVDTGVKENEPATFVCKLNKIRYQSRPNQTLNIKWFIKNKLVNPAEENSRYTVEQVDCVLKLNIKAVPGEDAGDVTCQVTSASGEISTQARLSVEEEPVVFVRKLEDLTVTELPDKAKFECELNKSFVNAKWYRNGKELAPDDPKYDFGREGPRHFLYVKDVAGKDEGEYTIVLQVPNEKKCGANLLVRAPPKFSLNAKYKDTITIKRGQPLLLEVTFSGHPEPKLTWTANDEPLRNDSRTKIETVRNAFVSVLMSKTQRSDSGKYQLSLENEYGKEKCVIKVNVLDKPGPPRNPKVAENKGNFIWHMIYSCRIYESREQKKIGYVLQNTVFDIENSFSYSELFYKYLVQK
jgi:rRNA maturation protein Nop10